MVMRDNGEDLFRPAPWQLDLMFLGFKTDAYWWPEGF